MVNWIAGNWPDRFRCLVNHDGIFDERSMYYDDRGALVPGVGPRRHAFDESGGLREVESGELREGLEDADARDPRRARLPRAVRQGLATFTALQRRGIESRFLFFPDENHWVLKPANSLQWHEEVLRWLDAHTKK